MNTFASALSVGFNRQHARAETNIAQTDGVFSVILGERMASRAADAATPSTLAWATQVIELLLTAPTRRRFIVSVDAAMTAIHGCALIRVCAEGRTITRRLRAAADPRAFNGKVRLGLPRATHPRDHLSVTLWSEAQGLADSGEALATLDALDIAAA